MLPNNIAKLRRVLLAYSVHNPDVEYCQDFNRIAAIALLFMHEENAFWCLVYIAEYLMPAEYYSRDKQLIEVQVDQEVMKELLAEKRVQPFREPRRGRLLIFPQLVSLRIRRQCTSQDVPTHLGFVPL